MNRLTNVQILDVETGNTHLGAIDSDESGKIVQIHAGLPEKDPHIEGIDGGGAFVLPGLINAHAHLFAAGTIRKQRTIPKAVLNGAYRFLQTALGKRFLRRQMHQYAQTELASGVTTIRSVGEFFYQDVWLREAIAKGRLVGPRLVVSGFFLSVTDGHGAPYLALESDSPSEGRRNVRKNQKQGVDWIKICVTGGVTDAKRLGEAGALQLTEEEIRAICEEAHKNQTAVCAHVESTEGVRLALRAGVDSIEHGAPMDEEIKELYQKNPESLHGYSTLVPTFQAAAPFARLPQAVSGVNEIVYQNGQMVYEGMVESYRQALAEGIRIGVGNDASMTFVTHYDFWRELEHHVQLGEQTPLQVLRRATLGNAELLGMDQQIGRLAVGYQADYLLVQSDPRQSLRALQEVAAVYLAGKRVAQTKINRFPELDRLLDQFV